MGVHFDSMSEGLNEILRILKNHPNHVIVVATDAQNAYCRPNMMRTLLSHQLTSMVGTFAGISSVDFFGTGETVLVGYTEAVHNYARKNLSVSSISSPEDLAAIAIRDLTVFVPTERGLSLSLEHTNKYVPFVRDLKVGNQARCIINGIGEVVDITTNCCDNDYLKPGERPMAMLTIEGAASNGGIWRHSYTDDGTNISQAYVGRTLRPITE